MSEVVKGERFNLTKESGGDTNFYIGLEWTAPANATSTFDLDGSVFACAYDANEDPKLVSAGHFVYFKQLKSADGAIIHSGDNLTGDDTDDADDEQIRVYLDKLDPRVQEISIIANIYDAVKKGQNFGQVKKAAIRICQMDGQGNPTTELLKFNLTEDYSKFTALQFGQIYKRDDGQWAFNATGVGFENADLGTVLAIYQ
jgi:tellurium resistance protein TerD